MADPYIGAAKQEQLALLMKRLGIDEEDLVEKFVLGSGRGGQKLNKTSSCVQLRHPPSGTEVKCQASRSRAVNRYLARRELCDRLEEIQLGAASRRRSEIEKIRRRKRRRSYRQKQRMLDDKSRHGQNKAMRRSVRPDEA